MAIEIEIGGVLAGFRIERLLGSGAMGAVYLSEDVHLKRKVAVKVLASELAADERFRKRFLVESQLAASLDYPNILPIYGAGGALRPRVGRGPADSGPASPVEVS